MNHRVCDINTICSIGSEWEAIPDPLAVFKNAIQHQEPDKPECKSADIWKDLLSDLSVPDFYWNDILPKYMEKYDLSYHNQFREVSKWDVTDEEISNKLDTVSFETSRERETTYDLMKWMRDKMNGKQ